MEPLKTSAKPTRNAIAGSVSYSIITLIMELARMEPMDTAATPTRNAIAGGAPY